MKMKTLLVLIFILFGNLCHGQGPIEPINNQHEFVIKEANLSLNLPNNNWFLYYFDGIKDYTFQRNLIKDTIGGFFMPSIKVSFENAIEFNLDIEKYSLQKRSFLLHESIKVDSLVKINNIDFSLPFKKSAFYVAHIVFKNNIYSFYLLSFINDENIGIHIVAILPKLIHLSRKEEIVYEQEIWSTLKSIKRIK